MTITEITEAIKAKRSAIDDEYWWFTRRANYSPMKMIALCDELDRLKEQLKALHDHQG